MTLPPNAVDMEGWLLACLIRDGKYLPDDLTVIDFFEPKHQDIARTLLALKDQEIKPDEQTVFAEILRQKLPVEIYYINDLTSQIGERPLNNDWLDYIKRTSKLRRLQLHAKNLLDHASQASADPEHLLAYAEGSLKQIEKRKETNGAVPMDIQAMKVFERKDDPNCVIGNRWLCKGGSLLLVSQSGVGKSSFALQFLVSLCINRPFFGIKAKRPLRVVMLQAENDLGDVAEAYQDITGV